MLFLNQLDDQVTESERKNLKLLLLIGFLYTLGIFLSNIFVNIFLWKQSEEIEVVAVFNLLIAITQTLTYFLFGKWAKRIDRVLILRFGIGLISLFFISVLSFGDYAADYNYLLGALLGAGYGFFWLAFSVLTFEVTEPYTRDYFNSTLGMLQSFSGMIGPITAGFIISSFQGYSGYLAIFFISFTLFILAIICSFFMERRHVSERYCLRIALDERRHNFKWRQLLNAHYFQGAREGIFLFLVGLIVYIGTTSEMTVGIYNFIYALTSLIAYRIVANYVAPKNRLRFITVGAVTLYLSVFWLLQSDVSYEFYVYGAMIGIVFPLFYAPFMSISYDIIGQANEAKEYRIEYIIMREIALNFGRASSIILFLIGLKIFPQTTWMTYAIIFFGVGYILVNMLAVRIYTKD